MTHEGTCIGGPLHGKVRDWRGPTVTLPVIEGYPDPIMRDPPPVQATYRTHTYQWDGKCWRYLSQ